MPDLRMTMSVALGTQHRTQLYERTIETAWLPDVNDSLVLFGDTMWYVKDRYMEADGKWTVELRGAVINPDEVTTQMLESAAVGGATWRTWQPWRSDGDEDFIGLLLANGWKVWHS